MSAFSGTCCDGLASIAKVCGQHALGIGSTIEIIEACDLTSIPAPGSGTHTITQDVGLEDGKAFFQWRLGETQAEFNASSIGSKGNQTFRNVLTVFLPLSRDVIDNQINAIINGEFIIRFGDRNGAKRLLGNENSPAMIAEGGIQEVINTEQNGVTVTFENIGATPFFYTGAAPLTPAEELGI
jgi:hypothetical protein